jgi:DNA-binding NtrC family response regulator
VLPLAEHFLALSNERMGKSIRTFSPEAREILLAHNYPGNVRELENTIERAVALTRGPAITADALAEIKAAIEAHEASTSSDSIESRSALGSALGSTFSSDGQGRATQHSSHHNESNGVNGVNSSNSASKLNGLNSLNNTNGTTHELNEVVGNGYYSVDAPIAFGDVAQHLQNGHLSSLEALNSLEALGALDSSSLNVAQGSFERQFIITQLTKHGGNVSETALASGMTRQNLYYLLKKHGIRAEDFRRRS